jgi:hypothetical protein
MFTRYTRMAVCFSALFLACGPVDDGSVLDGVLSGGTSGSGFEIPTAGTSSTANGSDSRPMGMLKLLLHDCPKAEVDEVWVEITQVTAISDTLGELVVSSTPMTVDLKSLQKGVVAKLGLTALPAGSYSGLRLKVGKAWVVVSGKNYPLKVPSCSKSGIKINDPFVVPKCGTLVLSLDWDLGAHLHYTKGQGYILRPVLVVDSETVTDSGSICSAFTVDGDTVGLWHFDTGAGITVYDDGPRALNGSIYGASWGEGKFNTGLAFGGPSQHAQLPYHNDLFPPSTITIEAWIKPTAVVDGFIYDTQWTHALHVVPIGGKLHAMFTIGVTSKPFVDAVATEPLELNKWSHVAGTHDGTAARIWVNGKLQGETTAVGTILRYYYCETPAVGSWCNGGGGFFIGNIDEVRVSNVVRYTP